LAGLAVIGTCLWARQYWPAAPARAQVPEAPLPPAESLPPAAQAETARSPARTEPAAPTSASASGANVVAVVNGEPITREELSQQCFQHYGQQVLESMVNKYLIAQECRRRNVIITQGDVTKEIERMAAKFGLAVENWLKMLKQERGIGAKQYAADIIWPTLALRRIAGTQLQVTADELREEFEREYGPAVKVRIIVLRDAAAAQAVRADAAAKPDQFGELAKEKSVDSNSASLKGLIPPVRHHVGDAKVEQTVFALKDGEVSEVIPAAGEYLIFKRECLLPASAMKPEQAQERLEEVVRDRKLRGAAQEIYRRLQAQATIRNVYNDPQLRAQMPGIVAIVNQQQVSVAELAAQCAQRHGEEVLEGAINRRLIEQAARKAKITISDADLDAEVARAASVMVRPKPDGSPDVTAWLKRVTEQQGVSVEIYRHDAVWPSVALKRLAGDKVQVTDEDLQRGYEANFGRRVRCRAIVVNNLRRAQEVWQTAHEHPTAEFFGDLAEKYSIEPGSQSLRGEVPPIQKYGGQPLLEKDAFALAPGEMSGIIDVGEGRFVILFCEGHTQPEKVDFAQVREEIANDVREKKLRVAMASYFDQLQQAATIDNLLAGTTRSPGLNGNHTEPSTGTAPRRTNQR
jgi:parvulin-like peptidyl-prolyl isomerase